MARELRVSAVRLGRAVRAYVAPVELDDPDAQPLPGSSPSPESTALNSADAQRVLRAIRRLKPRYRQTLEQRFGLESGLPGTFAQIAAERGVSRQCVYQECQLALDRLGRMIGAA